MSSPLRNIILVGATGTVGGPILEVLLEDPSEFNITILTRKTSVSTNENLTSKGLKVMAADYDDFEALVSTFQGQDAIVHASAIPGLSSQKLMIQAAVQAGVKRFVLNEFANSYENQSGLLKELEPFRDVKRQVLALAKQETEKPGVDFSWSALATGNLLDLSLKRYPQIGIDIANRKARLVDGGQERFTATILRDIGIAVRGILEHPDKTRNKFCHVRSVETCQKELLSDCEDLTGGEKWQVEHVVGEDLYNRGKEAFAKGDRSGMLDLLVSQLFQSGKNRSIVVEKDKSDNKLLGVEEKNAREVVEIVLPYFNKK